MAHAKFNNAPHLYGQNIFRPSAIDAQIPTRFDRAPATRHTPPHHGCTGENYFARTCAINPPSPNHQTSTCPKSWRTPNLTTRRMCTGEIFFAPTRAIDAQLTTRFDRAPATRRRTTDVRAKNISPVRAPLMRHRPTMNHRHTINRGARRIKQRNAFVGAKYFSPVRD